VTAPHRNDPHTSEKWEGFGARALCLPTAVFEAHPEQFLCFDSDCHGQLAEPFCRKRRLWRRNLNSGSQPFED
jgi:hypothetical protein